MEIKQIKPWLINALPAARDSTLDVRGQEYE
jgi:hypothetical protein